MQGVKPPRGAPSHKGALKRSLLIEEPSLSCGSLQAFQKGVRLRPPGCEREEALSQEQGGQIEGSIREGAVFGAKLAVGAGKLRERPVLFFSS